MVRRPQRDLVRAAVDSPSQGAAPAEGAFLVRQRGLLRARLAELERTLASLRTLEDDGGPADRSVLDGPDEAGRAQRLTDRYDRRSLECHARSAIAEVEQALARLDAGTYGRCASCGEPIDLERLVALPETALCAACRSRPPRLAPTERRGATPRSEVSGGNGAQGA
jgi:DnaK suppressor protein